MSLTNLRSLPHKLWVLIRRLSARFQSPIRKATPVEVRVIHRDPCQLTLDQWRADPRFISIAKKFLDNPEFRLMMDVLRTEHLASYCMTSANIEQRAVAQARGEGYTMCLNNIEALGQFAAEKREVQSTFETPEDEQ